MELVAVGTKAGFYATGVGGEPGEMRRTWLGRETAGNKTRRCRGLGSPCL